MKEETAYVAPDVLVKMMLDKAFLTNEKVKFVTSAFAFWEAISCLTADEILRNNKRIELMLKTIPIVDLKEFTGKCEVQNAKRIKDLRKNIYEQVNEFRDC